ncbi:unnamed protein product [Phaedon cochleariae]|uniref:Uncharacterized protein n=1 Tax=Phaedon cochleariae TaxID=80249 RepID=A0A9P0DDU1_PHACE|nr:unnamed protein product [Phaedon cochleariae]
MLSSVESQINHNTQFVLRVDFFVLSYYTYNCLCIFDLDILHLDESRMTLISYLRHKNVIKIVSIAALLSSLIIAAVMVSIVLLVPRRNITKGVVVSNALGCAKVGTEIMEGGGNAIDAAIATMLCEGVMMPSTMGLGGGFIMTGYNKTTGEVWSLNARETAPAASSKDMFHGDSNLSLAGGLSVAVPGELKGYWWAFQKFGGGVPWKDLFQPTIRMCINGIYVSEFLANVLEEHKEDLYLDPVLREMFFDPSTNETYKEGDSYINHRLARTLQIVAEEGGDTLHNGSLTRAFVKDIQDHNGIITVEDMKNYRPQWQTPLQASLSGKAQLYTSPLPSSGIILTFIMNLLDQFLDMKDPFSIKNYQRIVESLKFGYARRTQLGDRGFEDVDDLIVNLTSKIYAQKMREMISDDWTSQNASYYGADSVMPEDHGTAHISVLSPNGDAVSVTSTINYIFGAKFVSGSTGILLNNQMDDFSSPNITNVFGIPPSPTNYIKPGKRPMSSTCPSIILDENKDVLMIIGGAGGSRITSSVAQVILNHLWYGRDIKSAMNSKRLHHQLFPMEVGLEEKYLEEDTYVADGLRKIGHKVSFARANGFAAVTAISRYNEESVTGVFDSRRLGSVSYVN